MSRKDERVGADTDPSLGLPAFHGGAQEKALMASILDVVRAGVAGDAPGARQRLQRLIRGSSSESWPELRAALADILATTPTPYQPFRTGDPTSAWEATPGRRRRERQGTEGTLEGALWVARSEASVDPPVLATDAWNDLTQIIHEHRLSDNGQLAAHPTRTVLLTGPPGTGKTMTAGYLAFALDRPLVTLNLATTVASELGQTGANIQSAFTDAAAHNAVLFIDELDAIGGRRADANDIGEARRIVNVLLLELDGWPAGPLLVAATNHPDLLDPAIWRRFEVIVRLELPGVAERQSLIARTLQEMQRDEDVPAAVRDAVAAATDGLSAADMVALINRASRRSQVREKPFTIALLEETLSATKPKTKHASEILYAVLNDEGVSYREIARMFNTSHPTVSSAAARGRRLLAGSQTG